MHRRSVLSATGVILGTVSAGCAGVGSIDESEDYAFGVYNYATETHSFQIRIENTSAGVIHTETVELEGGTADEETGTFENDPVRIFVEVDSSEVYDLPWPASSAEEGEISSEAEIRYAQTNQEKLLVFG